MPDIRVSVLPTHKKGQPTRCRRDGLATNRQHGLYAEGCMLHARSYMGMSVCSELCHHCLTSLMVRDAEVCCRKILQSPTLYLLSMPSNCLVTCADNAYVAYPPWLGPSHAPLGQVGRQVTSFVTRWHPLGLAFRLISHCFHSVMVDCFSRCTPYRTTTTTAAAEQASTFKQDNSLYQSLAGCAP